LMAPGHVVLRKVHRTAARVGLGLMLPAVRAKKAGF